MTKLPELTKPFEEKTMNDSASKDAHLSLPPKYTLNTQAEMYYEYILESEELLHAVVVAIVIDSNIVKADPGGTHNCSEFWPKTIPLTIYESSGTFCPMSEVSDLRPCDIDTNSITGVKNYNPFARVITNPGMLAYHLSWLLVPLDRHKHFAELSDQQREQLNWYFREDFTMKMSRDVGRSDNLQTTFNLYREADDAEGIPVFFLINPNKKKAEIIAEFEKRLRSYEEIREQTGLKSLKTKALHGFTEWIPCEADDPARSRYARISENISSAEGALSDLRFWRMGKEMEKLNEKDPEKVFDLSGIPANSVTRSTVSRGCKRAEQIFSYLKSGIVQPKPIEKKQHRHCAIKFGDLS